MGPGIREVSSNHVPIPYSHQQARLYYQYKPDRLPTCPLTIHALLHIADSITALGPVWAYWAFPMERYCGTLQRAIQSRRFPYSSASRFITEMAQLNQIASVYDIAGVPALRPPRSLAGDPFSSSLYVFSYPKSKPHT